ncbi:MAG: class I SAM-dependent methyltransferase [Methylococcaceae bacterium]
MGYRQHAVCPCCGSKERERAIALFLARRMIWLRKKPRPVLHIAPEMALGQYLSRLTKPYYVSGDKLPSRSPRPAMHQMDITHIPYPDESFDFIICNHVLEHIPDDSKAIRELHRVLTPGGFAIIQIPYARNLKETLEDGYSTPNDRLRHYGQKDHVRLYGMDYSRRLRHCGFDLEDDTMYQRFGHDLVNVSGLIADEKLFVATKPMLMEAL